MEKEELKIIKNVKVSNMKSPSGNQVPNQFLIETDHGIFFQSYNTVIACKLYEENKIQVYLDKENWNYSQTTGKYRNQFLRENGKTTKSKIASGEYILTNLNGSF